MPDKVPKRSEIPVEKRWAVEDLYQDDAAWEADFRRLQGLIPEFERFRGHLGDSAEILREFLDFQDDLDAQMERLFMYAHLNHDTDTTNVTYQDMQMRAQNFDVKIQEASAFVSPELMEIPQEKLDEFRASDPGLAVYDRYFTELEREREHTRSPEVEELLASAQDMAQIPADTFNIYNNADITFPDIRDENGQMVELTHGRFIGLLESEDRRVRKDAFQAFYSSYEKSNNMIASLFAGNIKRSIFYARARGYDSTRQMYLAPSNIPEEVYDNLIEVVHEGLPSMYRYVSLRKRLLGVEKLHMYDVYVPIIPECKMTITFDQARETIMKALAPMGDEYLNALDMAFDSRWIDSCENVGKRSGAYCSGGSATHPYILLSYNETLDNMFALAHELGHAMHSYFSNKTQPHQTAGYRIFVAEVASTCNEIMLERYLLAHTDDKSERAYIINHFLDSFKGTFFRQTMFAEFEMQAHKKAEQGEALTAQTLNQMYYELNQLYFGPDMVSDEEIRLEWSRIPHFYTPFYVYQYATGISAAACLAERILTEGEPAVADYMKFLTAGGSLDPIDILKLAGVDMSTKEPVQAAVRLFEDLLEQLEDIT